MKKFEYQKEYVPRRYYQHGREGDRPDRDVLERRGLEGWELCAVGAPDSAWVVVFYFKREIIETKATA